MEDPGEVFCKSYPGSSTNERSTNANVDAEAPYAVANAEERKGIPMKLEVYSHRPIGAPLEIVDDVVLPQAAHPIIMGAFSVDTALIDAATCAGIVWEMVKEQVELDGHVLVIYPGNGGWLVQRLLESCGQHPRPCCGCNISRGSDEPIRFDGDPSHIVVLEDVIETGGTAVRIRERLNGVPCGVTLAALVWHNREGETARALEAFEGYNRVIVAERIRSTLPVPQHDVRSLSTLARKNGEPRNQVYCTPEGVARFRETMQGCLQRHPWLPRLGVDLGYRSEPELASVVGPVYGSTPEATASAYAG